MLVLGESPRSPFQMRHIENPLNRAVSAVENFRNQVTDRVRLVGNNLTHRTQRSQTQDAAQLERARAVIAQEANAQTRPADRKHELAHAVAKTAKEIAINSGPSMAVGMGVRVVLGHALGLQALAVAAGASAASRGVRETVRTVRFGGTYAETTAHILRHSRDRAQEMRSENVNANSSFGGIRQAQERFRNTGAGRVVNGLLHGGERRIAEFAYGRRRHVHALERYRNVDLTTLNERQLLRLREHAIMARITNGTAADVYENRQLARSMYQIATRELSDRKISGRALHDKQKRIYRRDARIGAFINIPGQAGLAALKAVPKTFATFFITDAFLKAIHVDTSARHNPLEGFENTRLGHFIENAIAPKSVASATELNSNVPNVTQATVAEVKTAAATAQGESAHNWTQGLAGTRSAPVAESAHTTVTRTIVNDRVAISGSKVLSPGKITAVKPTAMPSIPSRVPVVVEVDDKNANAVARAVVSGKEQVVKTVKTVTKVVQEQITTKKSLTQDIFDKKLIPSMESAPDAITWYGQAGTAKEMMEHIIMPNSTQLTPEHMNQLQEYLNTHPDASFGALWQANRNVFSADMDKWSMGTGYQVLTEHVVTQQEAQQVAIAEAKNAKVELADHVRGGKTFGLAKLAAKSVTHSPHADTISPPTNNIQPSKVDAASLFGSDTHTTTTSPAVATGITNSGIRPSASSSASIWDSTQTPGQHVTSSSPGSVTNTGIRPSSANSVGLWDQPTNNTVDSDSYAVANSNITASKQDAAVLFEKSTDHVAGSSNIQPSRVDARALFGSDSVTTTAQTEYTSTWLDSHQAYTSTFSTTNPHFDMNGTSLPAYGLHHPDSADYNSVTAYINTLGGLNIELHSGDLDAYGVQAFEPIRNYLQGGGIVNGVTIPRLGPVQEAYRAQQLINNYTYLDIALGGRKIGGAVSAFHHVTIENDALVVPPTDLDGIIGGGPDITALIGCSRGHVQAIQMLLNAEKKAPTSLAQYFAVLRDPRAEGYSVENAISAIVHDQWYKNSAEYSEFIKLYGYLDPSELTDAKYVELEADGYFTAGRLVFDLINNGGA